MALLNEQRLVAKPLPLGSTSRDVDVTSYVQGSPMLDHVE